MLRMSYMEFVWVCKMRYVFSYFYDNPSKLVYDLGSKELETFLIGGIIWLLGRIYVLMNLCTVGLN